MADVRLESVTKRFNDTVAVDDLSVLIEEGEFFSLLGPSGCGKTTTLRMIGGFEEPSAGRVFLGGNDITNTPPYKRDVNTVFQSYALFPHLDVYENVAFGLRRKKLDASAVSTKVAESLRLVDLEGYDKRKPNQLSGGQQQRVALARALVNEPGVLLLDEPLGALDLKLRKHMQLELKAIQGRVGITFIYVTHDQEEALTMSDRIAVMRAGVIEQLGTPQDIYENPATEFVAGFLGASNLLDATVGHSSGDTTTVVVEGTELKVPTARVGEGKAVKIGVRPEKITIATGPAHVDPDWNALPGRVSLATFVGVSHQFEIVVAGGNKVVVYAQNLGNGDIPKAGDEVTMRWRVEHTFALGKSLEPAATKEET
ncbi:MAG: spermidine/putrescine transport system ATP-binding protein [Actinomycetota bacterium]|nr:spermidine/putrescine transport system ATP-binding protein [Actinomycetota bacterium]